MQNTAQKKRELLLHSCCGPCSTAVIERLLPDFQITVFFYNPNIDNEEEYLLRKKAQILFIEQYNQNLIETGSAAPGTGESIQLLEGDYEPEVFHRISAGLEDQPEGGLRCTECFKLRLEKTAAFGKAQGFSLFGTTLTVSPHKNFALISKIGNEIAEQCGIQFLDMDFKKKDGYRRSVLLAKEYGLYRQNFCGCCYGRGQTPAGLPAEDIKVERNFK